MRLSYRASGMWVEIVDSGLALTGIRSDRANGMWVEMLSGGRMRRRSLSYRASGMWVEIQSSSYVYSSGIVIPRERYVG